MTIGRILGAAAALLTAAVLSAPAAETPRSVKVGVVDINRVLREYKKCEDLVGRINEDFKSQEDALKRKKELIIADQRRLADSEHEADSIELFKDKQALELRMAELQLERKKYAADRGAAKLKAMNEVWGDVTRAIEKRAKDKGLDLVLKLQPRDPNPKAEEVFLHDMDVASVLYHADALDFTDELVKALNAEYERGGRTPAPDVKAPAPPPKGGKK
jgi:outer membrane protein